jgi:hypothetical protein
MALPQLQDLPCPLALPETVLIELANAFKVTIPRYWLSEFLGDQASQHDDVLPAL